MRRSRLAAIVRHELRQARGTLALATVCLLGVAGMELLAPWPVKLVLDHVLLGRPAPAWPVPFGGLLGQGKPAALVALSLAIVAVALLRGAFAYGQLYLTSRVGHQTVHALRRELFAHLQRLSLGFHSRARMGELMTKVSRDTATIRDAVADTVLTAARQLLTVVGMLAVMLAVNWLLAVVVLLTFPVLAGGLAHVQARIRASARRYREREGRVASRLGEMLASIALVQAYGRERYEAERFEAESRETLRESLQAARLEAAAARSVEVVGAVGTWAAVLLGGFQVLAGAMTPGDLLLFTAYLGQMYRPIRSLARLSTRLSRAGVSARRLAELLDVEPEVRDEPGARPAAPLAGRVVFDRVSFDYGAGRPVLQEVSFAVSPGETVALVGPSGVGKSTVANLLLRFYDPREGRVLVDGTDVRRYTLASLREQIAVVLQDSLLFGASIRENIAYGKLAATEAEIVAAARAAHAHDFIMALEHGYETVLGERGVTLSGGQRRRLAIARALVRNAPILVLDEPMVGLDVESEGQVRAALARLMAGRTCLVITHDLAAAADADRVILLEAGRVAADGVHDELLLRSAPYRALHRVAPPRTAALGAAGTGVTPAARLRRLSGRRLPVR